MALPTSAPIRHTQIMSEFGTSTLRAARTAGASANSGIPSSGKFGQLDFLGASSFTPLRMEVTAKFVDTTYYGRYRDISMTIHAGSHNIKGQKYYWSTGPMEGYRPGIDQDYGPYGGVNRARVIDSTISWWLSGNTFTHAVPRAYDAGYWWPSKTTYWYHGTFYAGNWIWFIVETDQYHNQTTYANRNRWGILCRIVNRADDHNGSYTYYSGLQQAVPFNDTLPNPYTYGSLVY